MTSTIWAQNNGAVQFSSFIPSSITNVLQGIIQNILGVRSDKNTELSRQILIDRIIDPNTNAEISGSGIAAQFKIQNQGSHQKDFFVPYKSEKEWAAFLQNHPNDVTICNENTTQSQITNIDAGSYTAQVNGCVDCDSVQGKSCQVNADCGIAGQCYFSNPPLYPNVVAKSICNGLADGTTRPGLYTPPTTGPTGSGYSESAVKYPVGMQFPINLGGNVRYLTGFGNQLSAATVMAATGEPTEWFDLCPSLATNPNPPWDPAIVYPSNNQPSFFWDHFKLRTCIFDPSPLSDPLAIARVWDLSTGTCEEIIAPFAGQCFCSNASNTWSIGNWNNCSVSCGGGTETRSVDCLDSQGNPAVISSCPAPQPISGQMCNLQTCTNVANYTWHTSNWNSCSASCGGGTHGRNVICKDQFGTVSPDNLCSSPKPLTSQTCNTHICVNNNFTLIGPGARWEVGNWNSCSVSCGGGSQSRPVQCVDNWDQVLSDSLCPGTKPPTAQSCNSQSCFSYNWFPGVWSSCSASCGTGIQTRNLMCTNQFGSIVTNSFCSSVNSLNATQSCSAPPCINGLPDIGACQICQHSSQCPQSYYCDTYGSSRCEAANGIECAQ